MKRRMVWGLAGIVSSFGLFPTTGFAAQYLLFTCHVIDSRPLGDVGPGELSLFTDLTQSPARLRSAAPKPALVTIDVLQSGKLLTRLALDATIKSVPLAPKGALAKGQGTLSADIAIPAGLMGNSPRTAHLEIETDAGGTPIRAESDLGNGTKLPLSCAWAPTFD